MNFITIIIVGIAIATAVWFIGRPGNSASQDSIPVSHQLWNDVLKKFVSKEGKVNYKGLENDRKQLDDYLKLLSSSHPNDNWQKNEQLAYWINAYNVFTIELILKHYPVKSIRKIGGIINVPGLQSAWDIKFIKIENQVYSLGYIEHKILRKQFNEPRIHFAINCASVSCPILLNEAYTAEKLNLQLTDAAKIFLADAEKNRITSTKIEISKIFDWYKSDFTKDGTLISFLNKYSPVQIEEDAKVSYIGYNWILNE